MDALPVAIEFTMKQEGGYANDPSDPGLATQYGISLRFLRSMGLTMGDVDGDGDIDADDIRALTVEDAVALYRAHFWDPLGLDALPPTIGVAVMDTAVNTGPGTATQLLQKALNAAGADLKVDGDLGVKTRAAVEEIYANGSPALLKDYLLRRVFYYREISSKNKKLRRYLTGWLNRVEALDRCVASAFGEE